MKWEALLLKYRWFNPLVKYSYKLCNWENDDAVIIFKRDCPTVSFKFISVYLLLNNVLLHKFILLLREFMHSQFLLIYVLIEPINVFPIRIYSQLSFTLLTHSRNFILNIAIKINKKILIYPNLYIL